MHSNLPNIIINKKDAHYPNDEVAARYKMGRVEVRPTLHGLLPAF